MIKIQNDNIKIAKSIGWDMPLLCNVPCFSSLLVNKERSPGPVSSHQSCMSSCPDDDWWIDMLMRLLLMRQLQQIESNHDKSPGEINTQKVTPFVCSPSAVTGRLSCHRFYGTQIKSPGFFSPTPTCMQLNCGKESQWISGGLGHICPCPNALGFNSGVFLYVGVEFEMSYSTSLSTVNLKTSAQSVCNIPADCLLHFTLQLTWGSVKCLDGSMVIQVSISSMFLLFLNNRVVFRALLPRLRALTSLTINSIFEPGILYPMGFDGVPPVYMA